MPATITTLTPATLPARSAGQALTVAGTDFAAVVGHAARSEE